MSAPLVHTPRVIAQSYIKPEFRGVVWDLRRRGADGRYSPLDTARTAPSHFDWAWLETALGAGFADAELLLHGRCGISFKAEMSLVTAISPHLLSLGAGYADDTAQVDSFVESGIYAAHTCRLGGASSALLAYFSVSVCSASVDLAPRRPGVAAAHQ